MKRYIEWIISYRKTIIVLTALLTLGLLVQLKNLSITIDPAKLLPQSHPYVAIGNRVEELFGNKFTVVVGIRAKNGTALTTPILEKVQRITTAILKTDGVVKNNVVSVSARKVKDIQGNETGLEVKQLMPSVPRDDKGIESLKKSLDSNPLYSNLIVSKDRTALSIIADYKNKKGFSHITGQVEAIIAKEKDDSVEITLGGGPVFTAMIEKFSERMGFFFPLALLIISLVLYWAFRSVQALFLPLVTALMAVIWSLGIMALSSTPLDPFNATTPILILALSAGHAVQMMKRYYEEYLRIRREQPRLDERSANRMAVVESVAKVAPVMIAAGSIAAAGFFSLIVFDIKTIQTFGIFTGSGILSALFLELTFIPALRSSLKAPSEKEKAQEQKQTVIDSIVKTFATAVVENRPSVYAVLIAAVALLSVGASRVVIDNSAKGGFYGNLQALKDDESYNKMMGGTNPIYLLVEGKNDDALKEPSVLKQMDSIQRELEKDPMVGKTLSLADYVRRINKAMNGDKPEFDKIPDDRNLIAQYLLMYSTSGEPADFDSVVDYGYKNASIAIFLKNDSTTYVQGFVDKVKKISDGKFAPFAELKIGGGVANNVALNEVLVREKLLNIAQIAGVVFLIASIVFRSFLGGALVLAPLLLTVAAVFGVMGFLNIPLEIATSTISAMAVGIGADYAIYLAYRMREELAREADEAIAIRNAFAGAGKAVMLVATSVGAGYFILVFSYGFNIHLWLGLLISIAMAASAVASLTVFPALIISIKPKFVYGDREEAVREQKILPEVATGMMLLVAATVMFLPVNAQADELSATEIMKANFSVQKVSGSEADSTFKLVNTAGQERVRQTHGITKLIGGTEDNMRLVRFIAPADVKGTSTLLIEHSEKDDDLWIYLPALKKVRRLVSSNKKDSFVGTDFSYGDVIGYKVEDWKHTVLRSEKIDGADCWVVESTPLNPKVIDETGYSKRVGWIRKDNFVGIKGEMYAENGELLKLFSASDVHEVDHDGKKFQPMKIEMINVQAGHKTIITFENFRVNASVKDGLFTARSLEKDF
jgi:predicted RND superfamily exporter protein/outer membrane lipoprotein-sorting protein